MEALNQYLVDQLGPLGPIIAAGFLGFVLIILTLPIFLKQRKDPMARLKEANTRGDDNAKDKRLRTSARSDKLEKYADFLEPKNEEEYSAIKLKLLQAGYRGKNAVRMFHFSQLALGIAGLLIGVIWAIVKSANAGDEGIGTSSLIMTTMMPGGIGYWLPKYWVTRRQEAREENLINAFPDALDMMLVCVEAGQSLDQSIVRVAKEIRAGYPDLADEFDMVAYEMKAGKDRVSVLRDMSERCGVPDIASFVTVLIQSASFGTSISEALRVFSAEMRDKRVMRAEEKANKLPTKMTLATMLLTVPPLLVILIGPSIFGIAKTLSGASF